MIGWLFGGSARERRRAAAESARFEQEITALGEALAAHPFRPAEATEEMRADYAVALDEYEAAGRELARDPELAMRALDDGRYALARLDARIAGQPLPERLPLCFFDSRHGRSTQEVHWAPQDGVERLIAVCAADAVRLAEGAPPIATGRHRPAAPSLPAPRLPAPAAPLAASTVRSAQPERRRRETYAPVQGHAAPGPSTAAGEVRRGRGSQELRLRRPGPQTATVLVVRVTFADSVDLQFRSRRVTLGHGPLYARIPVPTTSGDGVRFALRCPGAWEVWTEPATVLPSLGGATACLAGRGSEVVLDTGPQREVRISHRGRGPFAVHVLDGQFRPGRLLTEGRGNHDSTVTLPGGTPLAVSARSEWSIDG